MNNNNNQNGKGSDIITKKGFLISLPGKKNGDGAKESSIHLSSAKDGSKNENANKSLAEQKVRDDKKNDNSKHHGDKNDRNEKNNKNRNGKNRDKYNGNKNRVNSQPQSAVLGERTDKSEKSDKKYNEQKNEQRDSVKQENKNENREKHDNRNDRRNKHGKNFNRGKNEKQNVNEAAVQENAAVEKNERNDRPDNNVRNDRSDRNDRNDRNRKNNDKKHKNTAPLSALSAEITDYSAKQQQEKTQSSFANEPSLEEKYKNAKPLSQQIAEQEMRAKGIKVPYEDEQPVESVEIVGVRFREAGKIYYFDPNGKALPFGTPVIVETARGSEYGYIAISNRLVPCNSLTSPLKPIERIATEIDTQKHVANRDLEAHAEGVFKEKVAKLGLEMNLIYVEYTFDNSRLLFYFTAETRIDFRELVKELAGVFRTRIELRQIGVRDEAKAIGGIGVCGRANCCNTFLGDFAQVSIKMAKDQSLSLNAAKISGACGKLMCCLRYEDKVYEEENARTPKVGSIVETPEGRGHVVERNVLKGTVKVALDLAPEAAAQPFSRDDVKVIGFNKQKSDEEALDENLDELKDAEG